MLKQQQEMQQELLKQQMTKQQHAQAAIMQAIAMDEQLKQQLNCLTRWLAGVKTINSSSYL